MYIVIWIYISIYKIVITVQSYYLHFQVCCVSSYFYLILIFSYSYVRIINCWGYRLKSTGSIQTVVTTVWTTWFGTQRLILVVSSCSIVSFLSMTSLFMPYNVIVLHFIWSNMRTVTPLFLVYLWVDIFSHSFIFTILISLCLNHVSFGHTWLDHA